MSTELLQQRALEVIEKYGSARQAGDKLGIDHTYLYRISTGERMDPKEAIARKLGLRRVVTFEPLPPKKKINRK